MSQSNEELEEVVMSGINADYRAGDEPLTRAERALTELMARLRKKEAVLSVVATHANLRCRGCWNELGRNGVACVRCAAYRAALNEKESGR